MGLKELDGLATSGRWGQFHPSVGPFQGAALNTRHPKDWDNVTDHAGKVDWGSSKVKTGCCVDDGIHNNGGFDVRETYAEVVELIEAQVCEDE